MFVGTSYRPETGATHGKLEFNPSRLLVKGVSSVRAAVSVAHSIFNSDQVQSLVEPSCQFEAAKLKRLDVTRDFTVDSVSATINSLERSLGRMRGKCRGSQTLRTVRRREGQGEPVAQVTAHSAIAAIAARL